MWAGASRVQNMSDPLEVELHMVVSFLMSVLGTKVESSAKAVSVHHWVICPASSYYYHCTLFTLLDMRFTARSWECRVTHSHVPTLKECRPHIHCSQFSQIRALPIVLPKIFYSVILNNVPECVSPFWPSDQGLQIINRFSWQSANVPLPLGISITSVPKRRIIKPEAVDF